MDMGGPATCNELVWTAQGPFQLIKKVADDIIQNTNGGTEEFCQILNSASVGRCQSANRCNFLDASLLAGWILRDGGGKGCNSFDINAALAHYSGGSYANAGLDTGGYVQIYNCLRQ